MCMQNQTLSTHTFALGIHDTQLCHDLVCVVLVSGTLLLRVMQVS